MMLTNYVFQYSNQSYPLFLLALIVDEEPSSIHILRGIEFLFILPTVTTAWFLAYSLEKSHLYHINCVRIMQFNYVCIYIATAARVVTFLYEAEVIQATYTLNDWPLILSAISRLHFVVIFLFLVPAVCTERCFATYYIIDYEQHGRAWISLLICVSQFLVTMACVWTITKGYLGVEVLLVLVTMTLMFVVFFFSVYKHNTRKLANLNRFFNTNEPYTLSIRFQVSENIRTLKHLFFMLIELTILIVIGLYLTANAVLFNEQLSPAGQFWSATFEAFVSAAITIVIFTFEIVNSQFKKGNLAIIGSPNSHYVVAVHLQKSKNKRDMTQMHFDVLQQFW